MWLRGAMSALFAVCLALPAFAKPVTHHTQSEISELVASYAEHFNQHDLAGVTALLTADAVIVSATAPSMGTSVNSGEHEITRASASAVPGGHASRQLHRGSGLRSSP